MNAAGIVWQIGPFGISTPVVTTWVLMALQATRLGYHSHAMTGIDLAKAQQELDVPERFRIEAAVAIGRIADKAILPEALQAREAPSGRKDISEFVGVGNFQG